MNVTLVQVRSFLDVSRLESFTKAAQLLHISQPALTSQIKQLEEELGLRLFDRNTRHVRLTREGRDLVAPFQQLLQEFELVVSKTQGMRSRWKDMIRFASLPSVAATQLPNAISLFRKQFPHISFVLRDAVGHRVVSMVRVDEVEFGITDAEPAWTDLESFDLYEDCVNVIFPLAHPISKYGKINFEVLSKFPLIMMDSENHPRTMLDKAFMSAGKSVTPVCEVTSISTAMEMVRAGVGLALLSSTSLQAVKLELISGMRSRRLDDPPITRRISLVKKADRVLAAPAQAFVDLLLQRNSQHRSDLNPDPPVTKNANGRISRTG